MQPGYFGDAGGPIPGTNGGELQKLAQQQQDKRDAINQMPQRDKPPVEVSAQRLFERLGQLQVEAELLTERLAPVSRHELTGEGKATGRAPTECQLVEMLDQAAERVEHVIGRLGNARARLCI